MKTKIITLAAAVAFSSTLAASSITFSAGVANNVAGEAASDLAAGDLVEVGTYNAGVFTLIGSGLNDNILFGSGFFSHPLGKFDTNAAAGQQLAIRWSQAATGLTGIMYYDITTGSDAARIAQWTLAAGDGGGTDFNTNGVDVSDLTVGGQAGPYLALDAAAVLIDVEFSGSNAAGVPSFNLQAVPEPSTYAALAGLCALGAVAIRRRRA